MTPQDGSLGFAECASDGLHYWDLTPGDAFSNPDWCLLSHAAPDRLFERNWERVGVILTWGMEDSFRLERGVQTGLAYGHADTNSPRAPSRPAGRGHGSRGLGLIDASGTEAIPLYDDDVRATVAALRSSRSTASASTTGSPGTLLQMAASPRTADKPLVWATPLRPGDGPERQLRFLL